MVLDIQRHTGPRAADLHQVPVALTRATRNKDRGSAAALAPAQATAVPNSGGRVAGPQPSQVELAAAAAVTAAVLGDPMAIALALQTTLRDRGAADQEDTVRSAGRAREVADANRLVELDKAAEALRKAAKKAPPWVKKLIGAVLSAVGTVTSAFGGAGLALVAIGAALLVAAKLAEVVLNKLAEHGIISEKAAAITNAVVKIAAAVAAAVTGQVSGVANAANAVAQTASTVAKTVKQVNELVKAAVTIAFAGVDMHSSVRAYQAETANIMAEEWGLEVDGAISDTERAADMFKDIYRQFARMAKTANSALSTQNETRLHAARAIA